MQVATVPVHDPLFEQDAPRPEQAQRIFKWVLTARVRRLQHVHHRRSICTGVLRIRAEGGKWQLEQVDLESEGRAIVAGAPA